MKPYFRFHKLGLLAVTLSSVSLSACASDIKISEAPQPQALRVVVGEIPRVYEVEQSNLAALPAYRLASNFVDRVIHDLPVDQHLKIFAAMAPEQLDRELNTQSRQLAFWINVYNGYTQHFLKTDPSLYLNDRPEYFGLDQINIAGFRASLEDIEHGVLRRGATIYTLGHLRVLFLRSEFIRRFAVEEVDYRLHFALNCGALSCPPVAVYEAERVDAQLDAMSAHYLQREVRYQASENQVYVPALMRWFSADFGGSAKNKRAILKRFGLIPADSRPSLEYLDYDWTIKVQSYAAVLPEL